jgi:SagB-type dehydrogenase family enzyme
LASDASGNLVASSYFNSFKSVVAHLRSTGLRTAQLRFNAFAADAPDIAADYLLNSRYRRGDREFDLSVQAYFEDAALTMVSHIGRRHDGDAPCHPLPSPLPLNMALHDAFGQRRSVREFSGNALGLDALATLLQAAGGVTAHASTELTDGGTCSLPLRSAPSGGGLFPIDLHVVARNVPGLDQGLYRFLNERGMLVRSRNQAVDAANAFFGALPGALIDLQRVAAAVVLAARPWRSKRKYGARGLRFTLMEAGYVSQNLHLAATALGLPSCDFGGYYDDEVDAVFDFDGAHETALHVILIGG